MIKGIVLLSLLILVESIQLVIALGLITHYIPAGGDAFNADLFPVFKAQVKPNQQMLIYHIFILFSITAQFFLVYAYRLKLENVGFQNKIRQLLIADTFWVLIQSFAIFKILVFNSPAWAWNIFYLSLIVSILSRIFWVEIVGWFSQSATARIVFQHNETTKQPVYSVAMLFGPQELLWLPLAIIVESLQVLIYLNFFMALTKTINLIFSFGIFILGIGLFFLAYSGKRLRYFQEKPFIITETIMTFLILSSLFKIVIYDYRNLLATHVFHVLLVLSVFNKIFWPRIRDAGRTLYLFFTDEHNARTLTAMGDSLMVALIAVMIYLPDPQAVLAKMFVGEQFHHLNHFIMAPGWAWVSGCVLDVDVISRYGIGVPIVLSSLAKCLGGFNHLNILRVIMWICIVYYILCYVFLRLWLKSFILSAAAILMGIKVQMFYTLALPQPLTYASGTPVRFMVDILFMFCIWGHLNFGRRIYLWLAALSCSAALFYMLETGLYLTAAFGGYLFMNALIPNLRREIFGSSKGQVTTALCIISVPVGALLLYGLAVGEHVLTLSFWHNMFEFTKYFTGGLFTGPFWGGLQYGQFWDLLIGFLFPIVYILTILIIGTLCILGKIPKMHLMVLVWCFYGLGAHHYYISLPTTNNYYMRGLPFVFVCFYWIHLGINQLREDSRQKTGLMILAFCSFALWTNHHFLSYPNMFNFSHNPMVDPLVAEQLPDRKPYLFHKVWDVPEDLKLPLNSLGQRDEGLRRDFGSDEELKAYYAKENDYSKDAHLIQLLTTPNQPVALISSFEIEMLMQANRRPLFYYFSMTFSRPMGMRNFGTVEIFTHGQLNKLIDQLQKAQSPYVFMERIFLDRNFPSQYAFDNPGLIGLLDYVNTHYRPYAYGKYLVALKYVK